MQLGEFILEDNPQLIWKSFLQDGSGIPNLTVNIVIQRDSDSYYWNGTSWVVTAPVSPLTMTKVSDTNNPGLHTYNISTTGFLGVLTRTGFNVRFYTSTGIDISQKYYSIETLPYNSTEYDDLQKLLNLSRKTLKEVTSV